MLSSRSRAKIRDKVTAFFRVAGRSKTFATLSFLEPVDDGRAVGILNKFLTQVRKEFRALQYVWVAERQQNGNIHFHMLLNKFMPVGRWNAMWIICQYNEGLTGHTEAGKPISYETILELYRADAAVKFRPTCINPKTGKKRTHLQEVLNPFDIREVKTISGIAAYLTKYVTNQEKDVYFACRPWHCSRGVSRLFTRQLTGPSTFRYMNTFANWWVDKTTGEMHKPVTKKGAFWVVRYVCKRRAPLPFLKEMEQVNRWLLAGMLPEQLTFLDSDQYRISHNKKYTNDDPTETTDGHGDTVRVGDNYYRCGPTGLLFQRALTPQERATEAGAFCGPAYSSN